MLVAAQAEADMNRYCESGGDCLVLEQECIVGTPPYQTWVEYLYQIFKILELDLNCLACGVCTFGLISLVPLRLTS